MKKVIAIISSDLHIKQQNCEEIVFLLKKQCEIAVQHGLCEIIVLGDIFDSRVSQRLDELIAFYDILKICQEKGVKLICIPGNHDKTTYTSEKSFLRPFTDYSNFQLIENYTCIVRDGYHFHFIPYFAEDTTYGEYLNRVKYTGRDVLFSHLAVKGSVNNDGTKIDNNLTPSKFKQFSAVFLGHYHNYQQIGNNIYHLPSIKQNNFAEDEKKGYTKLYDDLTFEIIPSESRRYKTIQIDLNKMNVESINEKIKNCNTKESYYRIVLNGTKEQMKSVDVAGLQEKGFFIQNKEKNIGANMNVVSQSDLTKYDMDHIMNLFKYFCEERKLNYEQGVQFFKHINYQVS